MTVNKYPVVLLAGGNSKNWQEGTGGAKLFTRLGKRRLWEYMAQALVESGRVSRIALVAPPGVLEKLAAAFMAYMALITPPGVSTLHVQAVPATNDMPGSAWLGVQALGKPEQVLFICDDLPLLTGAGLQDFLIQCETLPGNSFYPLVREELCRKQYPKLHRTFFTLKEGRFTGGNLVLMQSRFIPSILKLAAQVFILRKSPFKLAAFLGPAFCIRFLLRRLSLTDIEKRVSELTGFTAQAILSEYPEVAEDLDQVQDIAAAAFYAAQRPRPKITLPPG